MKIALLHHWLVGMRGGEKVLEAICELYPEADIFTLVYDPPSVSSALLRHQIKASWLNKLPFAAKLYPNLLPLYPLAAKSLDVGGYDLVISSDSSLIKTARVSPQAIHVCLCYSPPRYLWDMADLYLEKANWVKKIAALITFPWLKRQDFEAAQKVDYFVAISAHVQDRIRRHYHRDSRIIFPPVDSSIGAGTLTTRDSKNRDFYLVLGQLVHYKRADLAVQALNKLGRRLVVIGDGPERERIEKMAGQNIKLLGWQSDEVVHGHLASCRALIFSGEEDFGLVPVEAQMAGRPVIAYGKGGALETVIDGATGLFFSEQTPDSLADAINRFEDIEEKFSPEKIRALAMRFDKQIFLAEFKEFMAECLAKGKTR